MFFCTAFVPCVIVFDRIKTANEVSNPNPALEYYIRGSERIEAAWYRPHLFISINAASDSLPALYAAADTYPYSVNTQGYWIPTQLRTAAHHISSFGLSLCPVSAPVEISQKLGSVWTCPLILQGIVHSDLKFQPYCSFRFFLLLESIVFLCIVIGWISSSLCNSWTVMLIRKWIQAFIKVVLSGKYVTSQSWVNYPSTKCTICVSLRSAPEGLRVGMKSCMCGVCVYACAVCLHRGPRENEESAESQGMKGIR